MPTSPFDNRMRDALGLVRQGRLQDATVLIQQTLQDTGVPSSGHAGTGTRVIEGEFERQDHQTAAGSPADLLAKLRSDLAPWPSRRVPGAESAEPLPAGARFLSARHGAASGERSYRDYKLYLPSTYENDSRAWPLLVMLHGCRQDPDDFAAGTRMNSLAETHRCVVLYPAQAKSANNLGCWNWFDPAHQQRNLGEPALLAGMVSRVIEQYRLDPAQIYIAGLSAGGAMAAVMGANYPELFAAVGVHSGLAYGAARDLPSALAAMRQGGTLQRALSSAVPRLIVFHGEQDKTVHPVNAEQLVRQWLSGNGIQKRTKHVTTNGRAYTRHQNFDQEGGVKLEYWQLHQAGHAWSGGSSKGSFTDPQGPDASHAMLNFFMQRIEPCS